MAIARPLARPVARGVAHPLAHHEGVVGYPYVNAEARALVARFTTPPDDTRKGLIDTLVGSLKAAGVWAKLDALYILAAHDAQAARQNWVQNLYNATAVSSPAFTADRGYTGDGASSYLDTGFNPSTAGGKFQQNDNSLAVWTGTDALNNSYVDMGYPSASIAPLTSASTATLRNSSTTADSFTLPSSTSVGWLGTSRSGSAGYDGFKNNSAATAITRASAALSNANVLLLARTAGPVGFSARRIQAAHLGGALTDQNRLDFYTALATYMTAIGAA